MINRKQINNSKSGDGARFTRVKEDFICQNCKHEVKGTGYTNHCPNCLWSLHVDNNPGDRQNPCHGLMKPIKIELISGKQKIVHSCIVCGQIKRNIVNKDDSFDSILDLMKQN